MVPPDLSSPIDRPISAPRARVFRHQAKTASRTVRDILDRLAHGVVWAGGIATILSILGIFVYLLIEVVPLFVTPTGSPTSHTSLDGSIPPRQASLAVGVDEYQEVAYVLDHGQVKFYALPAGNEIPVDYSFQDQEEQITAVARAIGWGHQFALGTKSGYVIPMDIELNPEFGTGSRQIVPTVNVGEPIEVDPTHSPILRFSYQRWEEGTVIAAITIVGTLWVMKVEESEGLVLSDEPVVTRVQLDPPSTEPLTVLLLDRVGEHLFAGTSSGKIFHWLLQDLEQPRVIGVHQVSATSDAVTALAYLIGDRTIVIGTEAGDVSTWMPMRNFEEDDSFQLKLARIFPAHEEAVTAISASQRDKGFLTADATGAVTLHHSTSGQTFFTLSGSGSPVEALIFSPKANGGIALDGSGSLRAFSIENHHPEVTFQTLFQAVLYEGYEQPEWIWQSSSGSGDFEPKFGMMPLIFGTLKGTIYAMMLAVPLAVMGAIYTAMFMSLNLRAIIKPVIEVMAALPSVVLGFLAGLWLAPILEQIFPAVVAMLLMIPIVVAVVCLGWNFNPWLSRHRSQSFVDLLILMGVIVITVLGCLTLNQGIESFIFSGDYKQWLNSNLGLQYDQRNALLISFAMGFAVIPIIFSISEDSISNVPRHLIAGSLAMGATQWQTLTRLVLVSASPGIFSALMIGFGRAVGETMIVLMATGNTPILDWSIFNGFRTLSANIAVEMPEAPHGGTLYRILFLSGLILFAFTFLINTVAEVVRQRLRERYSQY